LAPALIGDSMSLNRPKTLREFTLEGKVCVITGAARGLGYLFCRAFLESGCSRLALIDLRIEDAQKSATEIVAECAKDGEIEHDKVDVVGFGCDVADEAAVQQLFGKVIERWGQIDVLVTSAGIVENYPALDYPTDRIQKLFDINVHGSFYCAREAARHMLSRKTGSIVLIASMSANIVNFPQPQVAYNASKAAVKHMAASLAVEWAKSGVRVNALSPGYMLTTLTRQILERNSELKRTWESMTPMGRMGEPEDLKGAIVFLASDSSRFVTGMLLSAQGYDSIREWTRNRTSGRRRVLLYITRSVV